MLAVVGKYHQLNRQIPHRSFPTFLTPVSHNAIKMPSLRPRWKYTEDDMAEAILDITENGCSPSEAAQRWGVPRRTLVDRFNGLTAMKEQIQPGQRLSKNQEDKLAFWILRQESLGYAPSHNQIRACVMGLLRQQGEQPELDATGWPDSLSAVETSGPRSVDARKPIGSTPSRLRRFIGTSISGRASTAGSSLKTLSTLTKEVL